MSETENNQRNAGVQQHHTSGRKATYEEFDKLGLTKRNIDYLVHFKDALAETKVPAERQTAIIEEMTTEILAAQKKGITAKGLYGTVTEKVTNTVNPPRKPAGPMTKERYIIDASYNVLWFLILFSFMYAAMFWVSPAQAKQGGVAGITCIILSSVIAGVGMPVVTQLFAPGVKHKYNGLVRSIMMVALFMVWMMVFYGTNMLPAGLNPVVSPIVNVVIGALALVGVLYMRTKYTITSGLFAGRR
ncbi:DUF1129 domain-containing protein [Fructilactobacillus sp. Tb1]|uniref:DUF1129 domain-containing protein n=1 Tax=Fructilactobacillus sp. Tb1 TaxID=3422304 RepID=UPI003D2BFDA9